MSTIYLITLCLCIVIAQSILPSYVERSHTRVSELFREHVQRTRNPSQYNMTSQNLERNKSPMPDDGRYTALIDDDRKIIMCAIPKAACTQWRKLMLLLARPERAQAFRNYDIGLNYTGKGKVTKWNPSLNRSVNIPNVHNFDDVKIMQSLSYRAKQEYYSDKRYLKVIHVRNPLTRVLSAWLSKSEENRLYPSDYPYYWAAPFCQTFREFVEDELLDPLTDMGAIDEHLRPQLFFCDMNRGISYDIYLKFEERAHWQPILFEYMGLHQDRRFKINFLPKEHVQSLAHRSDAAVRSVGRVRVKGQRLRRHRGGVFDFRPEVESETGASGKAMIMKHYSRDLLDKVTRLFKQDIEMFHYQKEVEEVYSYFD